MKLKKKKIKINKAVIYTTDLDYSDYSFNYCILK